MKLKHRLGLLVGAGMVTANALAAWHRYGVFPYRSLDYFQPIFAVGEIVVGLLLAILAFLPAGNWVYRLLAPKRKPQPHALEMTLHPNKPEKHEPN